MICYTISIAPARVRSRRCPFMKITELIKDFVRETPLGGLIIAITGFVLVTALFFITGMVLDLISK